jgi:hypothetical protein
MGLIERKLGEEWEMSERRNIGNWREANYLISLSILFQHSLTDDYYNGSRFCLF